MSASTDPDDDARRWAAQREALRALHREVLHEPVPEHLLQAALQVGNARSWVRQWMHAGALAASVLLAFGAGWFGHGQWHVHAVPGAPPARGGAPAALAFAHDAALAHAVYSPEKRHPVEVAASEQQHLVQWLSRRLDKPLKVPDLGAQGYALVGGRLLPGAGGARAQFMFEDAAGQRVTLYIGAIAAPNDTAAAQETAFRFAPGDPVPSFYWVDHGFGYALAGKLPREALMALASTVYKQL